MQNTQICTRLDGIRNHQSAAHNGGSRSLSLAASMSADLFRNDDRGYAVWLT
jgi:hypothetical protein